MAQSLGHAYPLYLYEVVPGTGWTLVAYLDPKRRGYVLQNISDTVMYVLPWDSDTVAPDAGQPGLYLAASGSNIYADIFHPPFSRQAIWAKCSGSGKSLICGFQSDNVIVEPPAGVSSSESSASSPSSASASSASTPSSASASSASSASTDLSASSASSASLSTASSASSPSSASTQALPSSVSSGSESSTAGV
jgi:hypothetical protein